MIITPFGSPVLPDVKMMYQMSSREGRAAQSPAASADWERDLSDLLHGEKTCPGGLQDGLYALGWEGGIEGNVRMTGLQAPDEANEHLALLVAQDRHGRLVVRKHLQQMRGELIAALA